jgi:hypothetical protein
MLQSSLVVSLVAAVVVTGSVVALWSYRARHYRDLGQIQRSLRDGGGSATLIESDVGRRPMPSFDERLAVLPDAIPPALFDSLKAEITQLSRTERSYLPSHKKGGTIAYETLCKEAPGVVAFYLSPQLHDLVSSIVGVRVVPTPLHDQSSCSVLFYEKPGDHIGWHFDHNFYKGRHFTVLLPIVNRDAADAGLSAARLFARVGREEREIATPPNQLVVFEGARIVHKATPIGEGERRVVLSMTFATDARSSVLQGAARRIKDTAFFGIRALWT